MAHINILKAMAAIIAVASALPINPTPTAIGSVTTVCSQYYGPNDYGNCFGRHCGPQNFSPFVTPTHCVTKALPPTGTPTEISAPTTAWPSNLMERQLVVPSVAASEIAAFLRVQVDPPSATNAVDAESLLTERRVCYLPGEPHPKGMAMCNTHPETISDIVPPRLVDEHKRDEPSPVSMDDTNQTQTAQPADVSSIAAAGNLVRLDQFYKENFGLACHFPGEPHLEGVAECPMTKEMNDNNPYRFLHGNKRDEPSSVSVNSAVVKTETGMPDDLVAAIADGSLVPFDKLNVDYFGFACYKRGEAHSEGMAECPLALERD